MESMEAVLGSVAHQNQAKPDKYSKKNTQDFLRKYTRAQGRTSTTDQLGEDRTGNMSKLDGSEVEVKQDRLPLANALFDTHMKS